MAVDYNDPKMAGYQPLEEFQYVDNDKSSRVRDYADKKPFIDYLNANMINERLASQAEAEAGTDALKLMTPVRSFQAIDARVANLGLITNNTTA